MRLAGLDLSVPSYTQISRRAADLAIDLAVPASKGPLHLVLDSTGLKVYGEGEWKVRKHGVSKRRTWRKLHLGVDERTGYIYGEVLTDNGSGGDDAAQVKPIIEQTTAPLAKLSGDGAYDRKKVWELLEKENIQGIIPPQKNAVYWIDKQGQTHLPHP